MKTELAARPRTLSTVILTCCDRDGRVIDTERTSRRSSGEAEADAKLLFARLRAKYPNGLVFWNRDGEDRQSEETKEII